MNSQEALETYLDFLETSSSSNQAKEKQPTPHIDAVLHLYKQRTAKSDGAGLDNKGVQSETGQSYESRLLQLEGQLTNLLARSKVQKPCLKHNEMASDSVLSSHSSPKRDHTSTSSRARHSPSTRKYPRKRGVSREASMKVTSTQEDRKKKKELLKHSRNSSDQEDQDHPSIKVLTLQLDAERERRWKAEEAAGRLVEHVRTLQSRLGETERRHELVVVRVAQLEKELGEERETGQVLQGQVQQLQDGAGSDQREKAELQRRDEQQIKLLRELEESYQRLESEKIKERTSLQGRVRESEAKAAGHERELGMLRKTLKQNKSEIQHLQELMAKREGEYQREKERYRPLDVKEVQDMITARVLEEQNRTQASSDQLKVKLSEQQKAYQALEEEFRMGLRIEASRYKELERSYQEVCSEVDATRQTAVAAVQKEEKAVTIVEELTAMVKEQKAKIRELSNSKQELVTELRERVAGLEAEVTDKNKTEAKMISLQGDKAKLESQVVAQQSVIDGLREERQLWGKELAHQGASLAQERGRLEAQLEFLTQETGTLRQQLGRERDAVRVKEKQVEDQADSIQHLKKALAEKEAELQSGGRRLEKEIQELKFRLEQEEASNMDMQDQVRALLDRKDTLKEELASKVEEKEQWRSKFNTLNSQWEEKVRIIDSLEENLKQLQTSFSEREKQLSLEKDEAVQSTRDCEQRLKSCDDAFREQLEAKEKLYDSNLRRLAAEKDKEIDLAHQKVLSVEEEMRALLQEVARERKHMETKFTQLTMVVQDMQMNFSDNQTKH